MAILTTSLSRSKSFTQTKALLRLPKPHKAQRAIRAGAARFNVIAAGRRFGKDILFDDLIIRPALDGFPVAYYEPTYKTMMEVWRRLQNTLAPVTVERSQSERWLKLITGGTITLWSLDNPDSGRGFKNKRVVINEAGVCKDLEYAWNDVIRATLIDLRGDAFIGGTPKGLNYFATLYNRDDSAWKSWHYTSYDNPHIQASEIDEYKRNVPERVFKQEILAEFLSDGAFFSGIDKFAVLEAPDEPEQHKGHRLFMASDWAKFQDYSVFVIGCQTCGRAVDWWRGNQIDYTFQRERMIRMAKAWGVVGVMPERNSIGEPNIELLRREVRILTGPDGHYGFNTTATTKPALIDGLAGAFENSGFLVPAAAKGELSAYEIELSENNRYKYSAPDNQHDDWVMALAILWHAMARPVGVGFA